MQNDAVRCSDLADTFYLSEGGEFMVGYFKRPWENRESYAAHSPLTFADRVTTPLLIQHGEADPRVPIAGAWKFYRALKAMGKTVELEIYPRGGHVLRAQAGVRAPGADVRDLEALPGGGGEGERGAEDLAAALAHRPVDRDQLRHQPAGAECERAARGLRPRA